ncbi:MAG TPA: transcription termination factor Rho, partial [Lachnospiraceae bacterium]|nr:transcription termination factor Rho [Lachnospiraceae bacterium]
REKYESLALADLKEIAKARGLKGTSVMKKAEVIEAMLLEDEKEKSAPEPQEQQNPVPAKEVKSRRTATKRKSENARKIGENAVRNGNGTVENIERNEGQNQAEEKKQSEEKALKEGKAEARNFHENRNQGEGKRALNESRIQQDGQFRKESRNEQPREEEKYPADLDSGITAHGILEVMPDGYGFIRCENYLPGENDVYVAPSQIRRFNLKTGDILEGNTRIKTQSEKFSALLYVKTINGYTPEVASRRCNFEDMTPIFPNQRLNLETPGASVAMRIMDLISPVGKGQRGMIVSQPKAGKTTLLKEVAKSVKRNSPEVHLIILLIDERPEEVTDIKEAIEGPNVEVIYSTFDELPEHHKRVSEMVIERAKRLVEHKKDVMILLDSITRLTRAYNLTVPPSGRTLSGGLDPAALHMPKRFFGAARNMRGGGSLTILATALVETGSKMDDVVYEEFKGTGNMELVLDRKLSERRVFPAIDIPKSSTRREDLLLSPEEQEAINIMRKALNGLKPEEAVDKILDMFSKTRNNMEFVQIVKKIKFL